MANVYKIARDPKGLLKKPPSYFFHGYDEKYGSVADDSAFDDKGNEKTKDLDNLIEEDAVQESDDDDVVFGVTSTPPAEVVLPEKQVEPEEDVDKILVKAFGNKEEPVKDKRRKRRGGEIRSTFQVDEDIRAMRDDEESEEENDDDVKKMPEEVDHGPLDSDVYSMENPYDPEDDDDESDDADYDEIEIDEYTDPETGEQFIRYYTSAIKSSVIFLIGGLLALLGLLYIESFSFAPFIPRPAFLEPSKMRLVLVLVDIQLLVISGAIIYESFINGIKALFTGKPDSNSVTVCVMLVCLIHSVAMCFVSTPETLVLYSSVGAFFGILTSIRNIIENKRNLRTFEILVDEGEKIVAAQADGSGREAEELGDFFSEEEPEIFTLKKTDFVDDAIRNIKTQPRSDKNFKLILPLVMIVAVAFAAIVFVREKDLCAAFNSFAVMCLTALPASSIMYISLPYLLESLRASKRGCAMVGGNTFEDCSLASAVSFNDVVVFPSSGIKVNSVRTYGEHRIDHMIMYAARVFRTVGGPLASVFENCIKSAVDDVMPVEIVSIEPDGIRAYIDGNDIYIGKKSFMMANNFGFVKDSNDDAFENSVGRIMYMTVGDNIAAKFYIKYSIYRGFEKILASFAKSGISIGIKSCDPNIDEALLNKLLRRKEYPVRIIKSDIPLPADEKLSNISAGLVCKKGAFDILKGFLSCDKVTRNVSLNIFTKFVSIIVAVAIVTALSLMGGADISGITPQFIIVYQLLWLMPVVATAIFG